MGAFPACAAAILKTYPPDEIHAGDAFITNHPYLGGSPHAPDMGVFTPIFYQGEWVGFAANMAHKSDIGGTVPGQRFRQRARDLSGRAPSAAGQIHVATRSRSKRLDAMISANSRTATLVIGDLRGQVGAARLGERRIAELMERYGKDTVLDSTELLSAYRRTDVRQTIALMARRRVGRRELRRSRRHRS